MVPSRRRGAEIMREAGLSMKNLFFSLHGDSQVALEVKNPPANAGDVKMQVQALGWEDPLEKEMATHSRILAWRIPLTEEPADYGP